MADLRELLTQLGFGEVRSLLQSGNLAFRDARTSAQLERLMEAEAEKRLALQATYTVLKLGSLADNCARVGS